MTSERIGSETGVNRADINPIVRDYWVANLVLAVVGTLTIGLMGNWLVAAVAALMSLTNSLFTHLAWTAIQRKQLASLRQQLAQLIKESRNDPTPRNG